jgi:hypothetical protein
MSVSRRLYSQANFNEVGAVEREGFAQDGSQISGLFDTAGLESHPLSQPAEINLWLGKRGSDRLPRRGRSEKGVPHEADLLIAAIGTDDEGDRDMITCGCPESLD